MSSHIKCVMFDIGGVVLRSPLIEIRAYERLLSLPYDYLNVLITAGGHEGAWQKFERGEMELWEFYDAFGRELSDVERGREAFGEYCAKRGLQVPTLPRPGTLKVDGRELFGRMMRGSQTYDPVILGAISSLRRLGRYRIVALTNNYTAPYETLASRASTDQKAAAELKFLGWSEGPAPPSLTQLFDDFVDSSTAGSRKPEWEFYLLACERNGVRPEEVVFLDDLGINLRTARELGMTTIHVKIDESPKAIEQLERILGVELPDAHVAGQRSRL